VNMQRFGEVAGNFGATSFHRRALRMRQLIFEEQQALLAEQIARFDQRSDEAYTDFDKAFDRIQGTSYPDRFARCDAQIANLDVYLGRSKQAADALIGAVLPDVYEWFNGLVYWEAFISKGKSYQANVSGYKASFFELINSMSNVQKLDPRPSWVYNDCKNNKAEKEMHELETLASSPDCPISIGANLDVWSFKFNCDGMEAEAGETFKLGWEVNAKTGEMTFLMGAGAGLSNPLFGAGAKAMVFFKFDKNGPVDFGVKGEAGAEMNLGPVNFEEKVTAVVGVSSVSVEGRHAGHTVDIFKADATK
jgi:hypothetical protein